MSRRNEARLAVAVAVALIAATAPSPEAAHATAAPIEGAAAVASRAAPAYQMRCWQHGRLIAEESPVALPPGPPPRVLALDRAGRPIYLVETASSTCQLRAVDDRTDTRLPR